MSSVKAQVRSIGSALPETVRDNNYFASYLDTNDEWITQRTGIKERRIWEDAPADAAAELGYRAAKVALERANLEASEVDTIICATFTPDSFFPSTAVSIANKLGIKGTFAFDISAACSGFTYGLSVANSLIISGQSKKVLLIGSEVISRTLDWNDRGTCILFGDGAGAVLLEKSDNDEQGILSVSNYSDGSKGAILSLPAWSEESILGMSGQSVFKNAVRIMPKQVEEALALANLTIEDIDLLIPHQANIRIIEKVGERLGIPTEKVVINVEKYGNTSSATIPIAMEEAWLDGRLKEGSLFAITALGGGLTAGAAIIRF